MRLRVTLTMGLAALCLFGPERADAQNSKDKPITVHFVQLPEQILPEDFKTYSVNVSGYCLATAGLNADQQAATVVMDGFKRVSGIDGNYGHLRVNINTGYVEMGKAEAKQETRTTKNKEGVETKTTYYWYNVPFSASPSYRIIDPEGNILRRGGTYQSKTIKSAEYTSPSQRSKAYSGIVNTMRKNFAGDVCRYIVSAAKSDLVGQYDFNHVKEYPQFFMVTKWPSEDRYEKHFDAVKEIFESSNATTSSDELREKLKPAVEFWKIDAVKSPGDDKKLKKVFYAANMNLAYASFYTDDFDGAKRYLQDILNSEGKDRAATNFIERIDNLKPKMEKHGIYTMHYMPDLSNALPPSAVKALEEEQAELEEKHHSSAGTITINGEQKEGSFMQEKGAADLSFGEGGNTLFLVNDGGEMKEFDISSDEVTAFTIGDRVFQKMAFSSCAKGKSDLSTEILETVYNSDKIKLYRYYPSSGALADEKTELAFQKGTDPHPVSVYETQFLLWEKGIARYFEDCEDLSTMCAGGSIRMEQDDLIRAARIYSELCE